MDVELRETFDMILTIRSDGLVSLDVPFRVPLFHDVQYDSAREEDQVD